MLLKDLYKELENRTKITSHGRKIPGVPYHPLPEQKETERLDALFSHHLSGFKVKETTFGHFQENLKVPKKQKKKPLISSLQTPLDHKFQIGPKSPTDLDFKKSNVDYIEVPKSKWRSFFSIFKNTYPSKHSFRLYEESFVHRKSLYEDVISGISKTGLRG